MDDGVTQADVAGLPQSFQAPAVLLDVREHDEWQRGHAADALHIPMGEVPSRLDELDRDGQLYVICHVGGRSQRVAQFLHRNGYRAVNVSGGMLAWAAAGRPVITDDGRPGTV
ncbi:rhodanese-like domain-containing protein [Mycobacterium sp. pUA109]|uniref:rhodanese-like domain-containing protein n=1 Tax=Mycobacterium sp. pUA109 TaxID=3238982 RepID=UPI00351BC22A